MGSLSNALKEKPSLRHEALVCLGISCCLLTSGMFDTVVAGFAATSAFAVRTSDDPYSGGVTIILACAAMAIAAARTSKVPPVGPAVLAVLAVAQVASLCLLDAHACGLVGEGAGVASGLLLGAASIVLLAFWAREAARGDQGRALTTLGCAFVTNSLVDVVCRLLPSAASLALALCAAVVSPVLLHASQRYHHPEVQGGSGRRGAGASLKADLVFMAIYGLAMGCVQAQGNSFGDEGLPGFLSSNAASMGTAAVAAAIYLVVRFDASPVVMRVGVMATLVAALYFSGIFGVESGAFGMVFMTVARHATFAYIWLSMSGAPSSQKCRANWPLLAFSAEWGMFSLVNTLSNKVGLAVSDGGAAFVAYNLVVAAGLVALIVLEFAFQRKAGTTDAETQTAEDPQDRLARGCILLAQANGLTAREREVLEPLVRGRSAATIAQTLGMSVDTARTHVRHIYSKTGIHNREDLMDEVERFAGVD